MYVKQKQVPLRGGGHQQQIRTRNAIRASEANTAASELSKYGGEREREREIVSSYPVFFLRLSFFCLNLNFDLEYNLKICPKKRIWGINVGGFYFVCCHQFSEKNFLALARSPGALGGLCFFQFFFSFQNHKATVLCVTFSVCVAFNFIYILKQNTEIEKITIICDLWENLIKSN